MVGLNLEIPEPQDNEEDATEKQKQFIRALMRDVGASGFPDDTLQELGKWQASALIDQLQSFKKELSGDEPVDTSRISGLDEDDVDLDEDGGMSPSWTSGMGFWVVVLIGVLLLAYLLL